MATINNIIMNKNEFSLRFQEYDNFAFLIDECGKGDTINNDKVQININQVTLNDGVNKYHIVIVDGQLSLDRIQE